jgi:hypothetical protein
LEAAVDPQQETCIVHRGGQCRHALKGGTSQRVEWQFDNGSVTTCELPHLSSVSGVKQCMAGSAV